MTKHARSVSAQQVEQFVASGIEAGRFPPGSPLPTVRQLTLLTGASHVTVWKALRNLRDRRAIASVSRRHTSVVGSPIGRHAPAAVGGPVSQPTTIRRHWFAVGQQLECDIQKLHYEPGTYLPSMKQLQARYHTTYRTLAKALAHLGSTGVLTSHGAAWQIPRVGSPQPAAAICFLAHKDYIDSMRLFVQNGHDYLGPIEVCASMASLRIVLAPCILRDDCLVPENPSVAFPEPRASGPAILGYCHLLSHPDASRDILDSCANTGRPVSVIDESGRSWEPPERAAHLFRVFPVGSTPVAGEAMGRYLRQMGHARIAYFSVYGAFPWSRLRLEGIEHSYRSAGLPKGVARYVLESGEWWAESQASQTSRHRSMGRNHAVHASKQFFMDYAEKVSEAINARYSEIQSIQRHLESLFSTALKDKSITAWVTENDAIAMLAAAFLRQRGIAVPQRLSLLSFDNSQQAVAARISSYSFAIPTVAHHIVRHLVEFVQGRKRTTPLRMEMEGVIVERDTSRAMPKGPFSR